MTDYETRKELSEDAAAICWAGLLAFLIVGTILGCVQ